MLANVLYKSWPLPLFNIELLCIVCAWNICWKTLHWTIGRDSAHTSPNNKLKEKKSHKCKKDSCLHIAVGGKRVRKMNKRIAKVCIVSTYTCISHVLLVVYFHLRAYLHAITNPLNLLLNHHLLNNERNSIANCKIKSINSPYQKKKNSLSDKWISHTFRFEVLFMCSENQWNDSRSRP